MKVLVVRFAFLIFLFLVHASCEHLSSNEDEDLITTPVTNNPNFIPESGRVGLPSAMPY